MYKQSGIDNPEMNQELTRLEEALNSPFDVHQLRELNVEPTKPKNGMLARADGINWNPGDGTGLYLREGDQWKKVCTNCGSETTSGSAGGTTGTDVDRYGLYMDSDATLKAYVGKGGQEATIISSNSALSNSTHYFVYVVRESGTLKMYVNNVLQNETAASTENLGSTSPTFTVGQAFDGSLPWEGKIDDCGVCNKALSEDERNYMYFNGAD